MFHRISTYSGASGSGVFDHKGQNTKSDGTKYVDHNCINKGVALDGAVVSNFIKTVVGPRLRKDIGIRWINF